MLKVWVQRAFVILALIALGGGASAQSDTPDYTAWENIATLSEGAVEAGEADDQALLALRADIAEWRLEFQKQQSSNDSRLDTLRDQIQALGDPPADGEVEPDEIADRRAELNAQMERLTTPRRTAEEAFSRANGIISEIDDILRLRQAEQLLNMGPWPVNPTYWLPALGALQVTLLTVGSETVLAAKSPISREALQDKLPLIFVLLLVGLTLLTRSRKWSEKLVVRIQSGTSLARTSVTGFIVSLGQIILPMLGLLALLRAIGATGLFGERGAVLIETLEIMGLVMFFALWLASRIFPKSSNIFTPLQIGPERHAQGRIYCLALGLVFALHVLLNNLSDAERYGPETNAVLNFPLVVIAGGLLLSLGWLLSGRNKADDNDATDGAFADRAIKVLSGLVMVVGFLGPLLAALGYGTASRWLIYPTILSLGVIGTLTLLQHLIGEIYAIIRPGDGASESLIPTLLKFTLAFTALPILALVWGARVTDLTETWEQLRTGLSIGGVTISLSSFLILIAVFVFGYMLTRAVQAALKTGLLPKTGIDPGGQVAIVSGLGYVGIFLAAIVSITAAGIDLSNLAIVAGALSVGIGFGLQTIVSNFVSGIILLIERPIAEGDWIEVGGQQGYVKSISVRSTRIETFDRTDVIVPNADLISGTVTNYTRGNTIGRVIVPVGVAYGTDTHRVEKILQEIADAHPMALANPPPFINFAGFGADSLDFEIRVILRDVNWMLRVKNDMNHQIAARFLEEGIEIPFAQRDLWIRNPEALRGEDPA
ncbi:DUF3772 domain-containing protein [Tateyamaria pelophila]|uniref:DUF3772 domain-containing protein n=1 Tax=Tateyamaria pelophila TaxID=328415 RepID=UPI001CBD0221|nr:DUF3772 domain-containing protein [Tateyamaria pelophila]